MAPESTHSKPLQMYWPILAFALFFPSLATWIYFVLLSGSPVMGPVYSLTKVLQFLLPVVAVVFIWRQREPAFKGRYAGTVLAVVFGLVVAAAILGLYLGYLRHSPVFAMFGPALDEKLTGLGATTPLRYAALAVFISIFHSFLEEYYWRWFVYGQLRHRVTPWLAYTISALGFAAHHVIVVAAYTGWSNWQWITFFSLGVAVGGVVWAWMYERTGSLFAPWISHLIVDVALLLVGAIHLWG